VVIESLSKTSSRFPLISAFVATLGPSICGADQGCFGGSNSQNIGKREGLLYMVSSEDFIYVLSVSINTFLSCLATHSLICCNCRMITSALPIITLTEHNMNLLSTEHEFVT